MPEKQSLDEFLSHLETNKAVIISLQSRAALAIEYSLSSHQVFKKLTTFFKSLGVKAAYDTSCSRDIYLIESCIEFVARYRQSKPGKKQWKNLPMLVSACPGWICYAEKTLGSYILPYTSSVKSPQQVMGATVKHHLSKKLGLRPEEIYHVSVMPCYDKKLEASRDDFVYSVESEGDVPNNAVLKIAEVDSVLTTGEVLDLIKAKCVDLSTLEESPLDKLNLQNVVRKMKIGQSDYHYLEVMACPSGYLNGGGQIKPKRGQSGKELLQSLEAVYTDNVLVADPFHNPIVRGIYKEWLEQSGSEKAIKYMHRIPSNPEKCHSPARCTIGDDKYLGCSVYPLQHGHWRLYSTCTDRILEIQLSTGILD